VQFNKTEHIFAYHAGQEELGLRNVTQQSLFFCQMKELCSIGKIISLSETLWRLFLLWGNISVRLKL